MTRRKKDIAHQAAEGSTAPAPAPVPKTRGRPRGPLTPEQLERRRQIAKLKSDVADAIVGPAPPKRSGPGRPPGPVLRPPTEAELARNKAAGDAAAPKLRRPSTRPRTVDAAWGKAMSRAAQMVRVVADRTRGGEPSGASSDELDVLAKLIEAEPAPPSETR